MDTLPKVFIIILNWNNWPDTSACLESLRNNDYLNKEVIVVDNGSQEKFSIPDLPFPVKLIKNQENLGFSGGNNVGIKYALEQKADYLLLLNNDTIVSPDFLNKLVAVGEKDEMIGFLGPKIYFYQEKNKIWFAGGKINWLFNKGTMNGWNEIDEGQYDNQLETDYLTGCCLLVKRKVIEEIGLMPEEYFLYYEDTDWSLKAKKAGFKCIFVPQAHIWHKGSATSQEGSPSYIYYHVRNGLMLARKFAPWYVKPFVHLDAIWRIKKQIIKWFFIPQKRKWARYILKGIKDFYLKKKGKYEDNINL